MTAPIEPSPDDELQFDTTEAATDQPAAAVCARCQRPLGETYYAIANHPLCENCRSALQPEPTGRRPVRLAKAAGLGLAAALLGAAIWFAVRRITNMELGLIAVLVGFLVGRGVRIGSGNRGGRAYQLMAVLLTYCGIAANYMPDVAEALWAKAHEKPAASQPAEAGTPAPVHAAATQVGDAAPATTLPADAPHKRPGVLKLVAALVILVVLIFAVSAAAPFLMGVQNLIGLLIIGFALWEAWKMNRRIALPITGPYKLGEETPGDAGTA